MSLKVKVNVRWSCPYAFNWAPRHEGILGEWMYSSTHSLTSALDGGEWSASHPGRFTPRERAPRTHWIGGWVGLRTVLGAVVKRKIPSPRREWNHRTPIVQPVAQRYTNWAITALILSEEGTILAIEPRTSQKLSKNSNRQITLFRGLSASSISEQGRLT
jgi:hypothetical protein